MITEDEKETIANAWDGDWADLSGHVMQIEPSDVRLVRLLGRGAFAEVYEAEVRPQSLSMHHRLNHSHLTYSDLHEHTARPFVLSSTVARRGSGYQASLELFS